MTTTILTSDQHQDLRVDTRATREFGDIVNRAVIFSSEFNAAHKDFPILVHKGEEDGIYTAQVILGFDRDENLFVENERWVSKYIPATLARGPFSLGYIQRKDENTEPPEIRVMVDDEDPRLGSEGHPVFLELGGEAPYLEGIKKVLQTIDAGIQGDKILFPQLEGADLLEPADIRIRLNAEQEYHVTGYLTVNQEKLAALSGEQLLAMNRTGVLALAYYLASSMDNFQQLVYLKNDRARSA